MFIKNVMRMFAVVAAVVALSACENKGPKTDPRDVFVANYAFTSTGEIDLYVGDLKIITAPLDQRGEFSIVLGNEANTVFVISGNDTALAYVSGNNLFMDPTTDRATYGEMEMELNFTYGKATLEEDVLILPSDVDVIATYRDYNLSGHGQVEVVATKKLE